MSADGTYLFEGCPHLVYPVVIDGRRRRLFLVPRFYPGAALRVDAWEVQDGGRAVHVHTLTKDIDTLTGRNNQSNYRAFVDEGKGPWVKDFLKDYGIAYVYSNQSYGGGRYRLYRFNTNKFIA